MSASIKIVLLQVFVFSLKFEINDMTRLFAKLKKVTEVKGLMLPTLTHKFLTCLSQDRSHHSIVRNTACRQAKSRSQCISYSLRRTGMLSLYQNSFKENGEHTTHYGNHLI